MKIFFKSDWEQINDLSPFTKTRSISDIRIGIFTIRKKWEMLLSDNADIVSSNESDDVIQINAAVIPTKNNYLQIIEAAKGNISLPDFIKILHYPWQIFQWNDEFLRADFELITEGRKSIEIDTTNAYKNPENIFIEPGAQVSMCMINAEEGPVYIGKNALIMEGCMIRGPIAIGENTVVKMGTKIYGGTTIGPYCTVGGEIKNSVLFSYSNKAHDGYLGDSVVGSWCNLGAGTSNSNVKNTAGIVKYYDENNQSHEVGKKAGLIMGDYSRCAINTSFNTGTMVGVCCNIFGSIMPNKFIPDFTWGNERYDIDKALIDVSNWKQMKKQQITETEKSLLIQLYKKQ
jgi:UDP-N-acetylglucosamine diphosphorylase / glucose-1-phosphate thymidylyltransferase / UDP-N-acetylgalactosamine diphosphorylase / glucosamine-1-phosphate N-acetyltransferase / galactosamine-1-phosphate N-acetyltransferase